MIYTSLAMMRELDTNRICWVVVSNLENQGVGKAVNETDEQYLNLIIISKELDCEYLTINIKTHIFLRSFNAGNWKELSLEL